MTPSARWSRGCRRSGRRRDGVGANPQTALVTEAVCAVAEPVRIVSTPLGIRRGVETACLRALPR
jgi:hypothetical protein